MALILLSVTKLGSPGILNSLDRRLVVEPRVATPASATNNQATMTQRRFRSTNAVSPCMVRSFLAGGSAGVGLRVVSQLRLREGSGLIAYSSGGRRRLRGRAVSGAGPSWW